MTAAALDDRKLQELEEKFDPEMRFRPLTAVAATLVGALLLLLSLFHYYTAGFGLLQEVTHRGVHLAFVLGLIFLVFPHRKALLERPAHHSLLRPGTGWPRPAVCPGSTGCWRWASRRRCSTSPGSSRTWPFAWATPGRWTWRWARS